MPGPGGGRMAVIVRYFPKLSETFIAQEIHLLEERGLRVCVYAMPRSHDEPVQPIARAVRAPVLHFPHPRRERMRLLVGNLRAAARDPQRYWRTWRQARRDRRGWPGRRRMRRFFEAGWLVGSAPARGPDRLAHVHSHFLYEPSEIGRYAAALAGVPHTIEAHAKDIYLADPALVRELIDGADALLTCTRFAADHIRQLPGVDAAKVRVAYHGVDTRTFAPAGARREAGPARLISVGRLVPKKGYEDILDALGRLRASGVDFVYHVYGDGRLRGSLEERARELGLADRVHLHGSVTSDVVARALEASDVFVCGSRPTEDGDRDGIPNSLAEAMACGLPVLATEVSGIPEIVEDRRSGRVVPPGDPAALCEALRELLADPGATRDLGRCARERVTHVFDSRRCIDDCIGVLLSLSPSLAERRGAVA